MHRGGERDTARDEARPSRGERHDADPPTRTTELGAPRPSSEASGAVGSATHWEVPFAPLTTNAYTCRPAGSFRATLHVPPVGVRVIGVACASQLLKSPTTATVAACGATRTNLMTRTESEEGERGLLSAKASGPPVRYRPPRSMLCPKKTPMPMRPAASAAPTSGESGRARGATSHRQRAERRTGSGS